MWRTRRFSEFSSSYRLKMALKNDVNSRRSDILSLTFGEPAQGALAMRRKIPSSAALLAFEAAARHGNFARAAAELALTEGAISRQIARLEALLDSKLFDRTGSRVRLNPAGAR
ncbi:helix-turn-helix domain-containing protein, partial [Klebsiella pneumoniae]